ncbi:MAG: hypothetical protein NXI32_27765, partial [bacterium]|nr:hypothetical protein [bacterium]
AVYLYDKAGGGFSRCIDRDGRDWIGFQKEMAQDLSLAKLKGGPGLHCAILVGADRGAGFPGLDLCRSFQVQGDVIRTETLSGSLAWEWSFGETSVQFRMLKVEADVAWCFLYAGAIAGSYNGGEKMWGTPGIGIRSDLQAADVPIHDKWQTVFFADRELKRTLAIHQLQSDQVVDQLAYRKTSQAVEDVEKAGGWMWQVSFGCGPNDMPLIKGKGAEFAFGFVEQPLSTDLMQTAADELLSLANEVEPVPDIDFWYEQQSFGKLGVTQRWINILGNISPAGTVQQARYRVDGGDWSELSLGSDLHRLARSGDFNVELSTAAVEPGEHDLEVAVATKSGERTSKSIRFVVHPDPVFWKLPYAIDFRDEGIQREGMAAVHEAAQIIDGKWALQTDGLRTMESWYDRVVGVGKDWADFDARVLLTIHGFTPSQKGPPTYGVSHCGLALRWPGHTADGLQPSRKWFPMGCQGELLLRRPASECRWRALPGAETNSRPVYAEEDSEVPFGEPMYMRAQVQTLENGESRYRFKHWLASEKEPESWFVTQAEDASADLQSGALLIVPHNSDVTIHAIQVSAL